MPLSQIERKTLNDTPRKKKLKKELFVQKEEKKTLKRKLDVTERNLSFVDKQLEEQTILYNSTVKGLTRVMDSFHQDIYSLSDDKSALQTKLTEMEMHYEEKIELLDKIQEKLGARTSEKSRAKNIRRVAKRSKETISKQKEHLKEKDNVITGLESEREAQLREIEKSKQQLKKNVEQMQALEKKVAELRKEKTDLSKTISYLKQKCKKRDTYFSEARDKNAKQIELLEAQISQLRKANSELEQLAELIEDPEIKTFADGKFTDEIREVIMQLVSYNVSLKQIDYVIKTVLKILAGKNVDRLPSQALKSRIGLEARHIADAQVANAMLQNADMSSIVGNCLHGDGTTKFHKHYQGFQVTTTEGQTLSLGMLEMGRATTADLTEALTRKLNDLAHSFYGR